MPSPIIKTYYGKFYKRKGGAWKISKRTGDVIYVGSGNGTHSRRNIEQDKRRRAKKSSLRKRYPQEYD